MFTVKVDLCIVGFYFWYKDTKGMSVRQYTYLKTFTLTSLNINIEDP